MVKYMNDRILEREEYILKNDGKNKITVRDLQLEVLSIMDEIHRVCEKMILNMDLWLVLH